MTAFATGHKVTADEFNAKKDKELGVPVTASVYGGVVSPVYPSVTNEVPTAVCSGATSV